MATNELNKWQKQYIDEYHDGKMPRRKVEKQRLNLLGKVKNYVIVDFPDFNGAEGFKPAHTEKYEVTLTECDIPNGKISVRNLAANLDLWLSRGYTVHTE